MLISGVSNMKPGGQYWLIKRYILAQWPSVCSKAMTQILQKMLFFFFFFFFFFLNGWKFKLFLDLDNYV